jgi:uncharacterized iron-regulated protein
MRCVLFGLMLVGCVHARQHPPEHSLVDKQQAAVTDAAFIARARQARFVLIGEAHDNACDHLQQARLIRLLRPSVVGFEMVAVDAQPVLDRAPELGLTALPEKLSWMETWGVPFNLYAPVFEAALESHARLVALNAPKAIVKVIREKGLEGLSAEQQVAITPVILPPPPEQETMLREAMAGHGTKLTPEDVETKWQRFVRVQSFWDSQMAYRAAEAARGHDGPVVLIAGGGHVEHGWGIAHRLEHFAPGAATLSIMPRRPDEPFEPASADLFFTCLASPTVAQR